MFNQLRLSRLTGLCRQLKMGLKGNDLAVIILSGCFSLDRELFKNDLGTPVW